MGKARKLAVITLEIVLIFVVVFLCVVSSIVVAKKTNQELDNHFFGTRNEEIIIELWHVETFEGGTASRAKYLEQRAIEFEKQNKGVFILVKSVTKEELKIAVENDALPDFISFGYGVQHLIKEKLVPLNLKNAKSLKSTFLASGQNLNSLLAVPYCYSRYLLFSTPEKMEKAGITENTKLSDVLFSAGYSTSTKKKQKNIYSCVFGGLNNPGIKVISNKQNAILPESTNLSSFNAYLKFMGGSASILIGNLRDLARLENKLASGEINKLLCEPYLKQTSLTQNFAVFNNEHASKQTWANEFIDYCLKPSCQEKLKGIGLLSPCQEIYNQNTLLGTIEAQSKTIEVAKLF